jgi:hypothetical protein
LWRITTGRRERRNDRLPLLAEVWKFVDIDLAVRILVDRKVVENPIGRELEIGRIV